MSSPSYSRQLLKWATDVARSPDLSHDSVAEAASSERSRSATPVMNQDKVVAFDLPAVARKKVSVGFDGGQMSSDAGGLLLRGVERHLGIAPRPPAIPTPPPHPLPNTPPPRGT